MGSDKDIYTIVDNLTRKKENYQIRTTAFLKGRLKNDFITDCIKREKFESAVSYHIFDTYYSLMKKRPDLQSLPLDELKNELISIFPSL